MSGRAYNIWDAFALTHTTVYGTALLQMKFLWQRENNMVKRF